MKIIKRLLAGAALAAVISAVCALSALAASKYYIEVNCTENIVTVFSADKNGKYTVPEKAFVCSVGKGTPYGTFSTTDRYVWRALFGGVYGQYATRITGSILFHSVPYYTANKNNLEYEEYNKLGQTASMGCIRLSVKDAKWIYDNCGYATKVKIYGGEGNLPLTPEPPIKIDVTNKELRGWDPTDPDENNPWHSLAEEAADEQEKEADNSPAIAEEEPDYYKALEKPETEAEADDDSNILMEKTSTVLSSASEHILKAQRDARPRSEVKVIAVQHGDKPYALHCLLIDGRYYAALREMEDFFRTAGLQYYFKPLGDGTYSIIMSLFDLNPAQELIAGAADKKETMFIYNSQWHNVSSYIVNGTEVYSIDEIAEILGKNIIL